MSTPRLSVLIPVYNGEPFLAECIESVLAQDFDDYELLISDDYSTDGTGAVIKRYAAKDRRIRWWTNPATLELGGNFNRCLTEARGEFVKFVFADDKLLDTTMIRRMVEVLEQQPDVSLVGCASHVIDEHSQLLAFRNHFGRSGVWNGREIIVRCFETPGNIIGEPSLVMFRRSQVGSGFNSRYRQIVDLEFYFHLLEQGKFAFIAEPLAAWRRHPAQQTEVNRRTGLSAQEELWLIREWFSKPWLRECVTRQMLFTQIRHLKKQYGAEAGDLTSEMMCRLGRGWFTAYWLKRKITRPLKKMMR
jgi:glycosyltransferase involved in cell wall biosynthesis